MTIKTTHVGSLPREQNIVDLIFAKEAGQTIDAEQFATVAREHVNLVVQKQRDAGIDIVSDGESAKLSYATYVKERLAGFAGDSPRRTPGDLKLFPAFLERLAKSGGTPNYTRPQCVAPVSVKDTIPLELDLANLQAAVDTHGGTPFMNAISPGTIALFLPNAHYASEEEYLDALAQVMQAEYEAIVAAGFLLQLDCPDLALARHMMFTEQSDDEFVAGARRRMEILNAVLVNIPAECMRLHVCWGNYEGPHICDISMDAVLDVFLSAKAKYLLFETANPRHAHEWKVFEQRRDEIPADKVLVPGVIDSTSNFVEHPQLVAQRIERFIDIIGAERVIAGTDCGFGTFAGFGAVAPDITWAKLASLSEAAALVNFAGG